MTHPIHQKMSSCYCLLMSKQTKLCLGAEQVAAACACAKKPSGSPVMSFIYFLFIRTSPRSVIVKELYDGQWVRWNNSEDSLLWGKKGVSLIWRKPAEWHLAHVHWVLGGAGEKSFLLMEAQSFPWHYSHCSLCSLTLLRFSFLRLFLFTSNKLWAH